ncbi:xanthomonadin biosynthesis protein [Rhodanobacter sp. A1T4]|uniref:xanthomonadin biosynthesis protein n=1 Tax=Rhodanobacter sp. A1T4 TaxID=2723087 RepID=UPI0017FE7354|nr:xanthomonadin biosynthesis protein [Rhodanobacter sp. A1T4]MBB6248245.1 putative membrane protein [Rhodanobacter sp. A1T4]
MTYSLPPCEQPSSAVVMRRYLLPLLLAYPVLAIVGDVTHRQIFPLIALLLLATAFMLPWLLTRRLGAWLLWLTVLAALVSSSLFGFADLLLESVPILVSALLAIGFGRTLGTPEPLVARFIVVLEGPERLAQPGVARYAREITWSWTLLLAAQALLLAVLLLCAEHAGVLARLGFTSPLAVPDRWAAMWLHVGGYLVLAVAFVLEYGYRRWRLRHLSHPGLHDMLLKLVLHWPELMRGKGAIS